MKFNTYKDNADSPTLTDAKRFALPVLFRASGIPVSLCTDFDIRPHTTDVRTNNDADRTRENTPMILASRRGIRLRLKSSQLRMGRQGFASDVRLRARAAHRGRHQSKEVPMLYRSRRSSRSSEQRPEVMTYRRMGLEPRRPRSLALVRCRVFVE